MNLKHLLRLEKVLENCEADFNENAYPEGVTTLIGNDNIINDNKNIAEIMTNHHVNIPEIPHNRMIGNIQIMLLIESLESTAFT